LPRKKAGQLLASPGLDIIPVFQVLRTFSLYLFLYRPIPSAVCM
jgi:hypothetical protein